MAPAKTRQLLLLALAATVLGAGVLHTQETRRVVRNPSPNPKDDTKANSPSVPEGYALTGHFDRIVVIRLKSRTNLLEGMKKVVADQHIQNGVILSAIGSLRSYEVHSVSNRDLPTQDTIVKNPTQPVDLVSRCHGTDAVPAEHVRRVRRRR